MGREAEIVDAAESVLEREGLEALTMRRLAAELGIRAPSLYKHVTGKDDIVLALQERALREQVEALSGSTDLAGLAAAYRAWALRHPRLYELISRHSLDRSRLPPGLEDAAAAPLLAAVGHDLTRARAVWACAHGLVDLELAGRFPPGTDLDAVWAVAVERFGVEPAR